MRLNTSENFYYIYPGPRQGGAMPRGGTLGEKKE